MILLKNPNWRNINTKKHHQNTLAKNQNRLHAICGRYLLGCFQASRWRFQEWGVVQQNPRYKVTLTEEERRRLETLTHGGKTALSKFIHARALLLCDAGEHGSPWKVAEVAEALGVTHSDGRVGARCCVALWGGQNRRAGSPM